MSHWRKREQEQAEAFRFNLEHRIRQQVRWAMDERGMGNMSAFYALRLGAKTLGLTLADFNSLRIAKERGQ
jgi:hypothetical protein